MYLFIHLFFLSDGMDKHMSETLIITKTDGFCTLFSGSLNLTYDFDLLFEVCLSRVLSYASYLFLSDDMDKHMSDPIIKTLTDLCPAVFL